VKHLLLATLLLTSSCSVLTDFSSGDNNGTSNNNTSNVNNTVLELCDNGIDDDGDGYGDCWDPDCDGDPACDCDDTTLFFDSGKTCDHDEQCLLVQGTTEIYAECLDASHTEGGEFFGSCGADGACAMGSVCLFDGYYFNYEYVPLYSKNHDWCPQGRGICIADFTDMPSPDDITFCIETHTCEPTDANACAGLGFPDLACNAFRNENGGAASTRCMPHGEKTFGQECGFYADCEPGLVCVGDDTKKVCLPWCNTEDEDACLEIGEGAWYCQTIGADPWGVCLLATSSL